MGRALLIVRTPLQARLLENALIEEGHTEYDLLFFTQHRSPKVLHAFKILGEKARKKFLLYVPLRFRWFATEIVFYSLGRALLCIWSSQYDSVLFGSLDSPAIGTLATRAQCTLVTVDDGSANILQMSPYFQNSTGARATALRRLMNAPDISMLRGRITRHFTIFPGTKNTIEAKKLTPLPNWPPSRRMNPAATPLVVFVSGGEHLFMTKNDLRSYQQYLEKISFDYRISHPMDRVGLVGWVPELPHEELVAEEALAMVSSNRSIHLVGTMSTVMLTTNKLAERRTVVLHKNHHHLKSTAESTGCEVVLLDRESLS